MHSWSNLLAFPELSSSNWRATSEQFRSRFSQIISSKFSYNSFGFFSVNLLGFTTLFQRSELFQCSLRAVLEQYQNAPRALSEQILSVHFNSLNIRNSSLFLSRNFFFPLEFIYIFCRCCFVFTFLFYRWNIWINFFWCRLGSAGQFQSDCWCFSAPSFPFSLGAVVGLNSGSKYVIVYRGNLMKMPLSWPQPSETNAVNQPRNPPVINHSLNSQPID